MIQGGVRVGGVRWCDPTDRDNWMMIEDWASGASGMWTGWKRAAFCRVCSDETAIEARALERGRALPRRPQHVKLKKVGFTINLLRRALTTHTYSHRLRYNPALALVPGVGDGHRILPKEAGEGFISGLVPYPHPLISN